MRYARLNVIHKRGTLIFSQFSGIIMESITWQRNNFTRTVCRAYSGIIILFIIFMIYFVYFNITHQFVGALQVDSIMRSYQNELVLIGPRVPDRFGRR